MWFGEQGGYNNRGFYELQQDQTDLDLTDLLQACAMKPSYAMPHFNLGLLYAITGDADRSVDQYHQAILDNGPFKNTEGESYARIALKSHPYSPALKQALGILMAANARPGLKHG